MTKGDFAYFGASDEPVRTQVVTRLSNAKPVFSGEAARKLLILEHQIAEEKRRSQGQSIILFESILPYWKHCTQCGKKVARQGEVKTWAKWRRCFECVSAARPKTDWIYCMHCGTQIRRTGYSVTCGTCRGIEHYVPAL